MKFIGVVPLAVGQSPPVAKTKAVFSEYRRCPDGWKMAVAAFLDDPEHGRGRRAQLSRDTGVSKSMLTALLKLTTDTPPGPRASKVAKAVADWTGIPLPDEALEDEEIAALVADAVAMQRISPRLLHQRPRRPSGASWRACQKKSATPQAAWAIPLQGVTVARQRKTALDRLLDDALALKDIDPLLFEALCWRLHVAARLAIKKASPTVVHLA